jgi:hypothetical protein
LRIFQFLSIKPRAAGAAFEEFILPFQLFDANGGVDVAEIELESLLVHAVSPAVAGADAVMAQQAHAIA